MMIGLFTELEGAGGVQRASRHLAAALAEVAGTRGLGCRLQALNDSAGKHSFRVGAAEFQASGYSRGKAHYVLGALRVAVHQPKIVLAGHANLAPLVRAMKAVSPGLRTVVCTHGIEVWSPLAALRRRALRQATRVLAPSSHTAQQLVELQGVRPEKVRLLPWALDPDFASLAQSATGDNLPVGFPSGRVILTVGRWAANDRYKGVEHLIEALSALVKELPDLHLVAIGDGDDRSRLETLAQRSVCADRIRFLGSVSHQELAECYQRCDVFALPSGGEGFGMVFLEAMACGKPVIGGAHGGTPDLVVENETGFLVRHGDVAGLRAALLRLLTDADLRDRMGECGRRRAFTRFRFEDFRLQLRKVLEECAAI